MSPQTIATQPLRTEGLSGKAILAALLPTIGGVVAVAVQWIATGEFDRAELATALSAVLTSLLAFVGAYLGHPGTVRVAIPPGKPEPLAGEGTKYAGA